MVFSIKQHIRQTCPPQMVGTFSEAYQKTRMTLYKADMMLHPQRMTYWCPCCDLRFRSFVVGFYLEHPERYNPARYTQKRQDVLCPVCHSLPRHRILATWCTAHLDLFRTDKILYFAPEPSMMRYVRRNGIVCTTADMYNEADLKLDIQSTGLPDQSYDMVVCNHVLEHVNDYRTALKEIFRILRPGGSLVCSFPMDSAIDLVDEDPSVITAEERYRRFGQSDHLRVFGMRAHVVLEEAGFEVQVIDGNTYPAETLPVVGPADYDINRLFWCKRP